MMTQIPAEEKWEGAGGREGGRGWRELRDMCKGSRGRRGGRGGLLVMSIGKGDAESGGGDVPLRGKR